VEYRVVIGCKEPPLPGKISTDQAVKFMEGVAKGEPGGWDILKGVMKEKVREVI
jgi:pyruvate dehydrogenase (quinone)